MIINFIIKGNNFVNNFYSMFSYMNLFTIINYNYSENIKKTISYMSYIDICSLSTNISCLFNKQNIREIEEAEKEEETEKKEAEIKYKYSQYNYILRNAEKNKKLVNFLSIENIKNEENIFFLQDDGPIMF